MVYGIECKNVELHLPFLSEMFPYLANDYNSAYEDFGSRPPYIIPEQKSVFPFWILQKQCFYINQKA
jgi:hypothetical protein